MNTKTIQVPAALLLDPGLTPATKLVWVAAALGPATPALLADRVALSRPTVQTGLARLAAAGWSLPPQPLAPHKSALVPINLAEDPDIGAPAKLLYAILQLTPEAGRFTYATLRALAHADARTLKAALTQLEQAGWVKYAQKNKRAPVMYTLTRPRKVPGLIFAQRRYQRARFKGEAIMRELLTALIDLSTFEDDAAPEFLANPLTDQPLELDRYYPTHMVAFEFQGPQHYRATDIYSEQQSKKQRARDYIKAGLCADHQVTLVIINAEDLTLEGIQQKLPPHLPRRDLTGHGPLIRWLNRTGARYQAEAAK